MKKVFIADILWSAANEYLNDYPGNHHLSDYCGDITSQYSCDAIDSAICVVAITSTECNFIGDGIKWFLESLGFPQIGSGFHVFNHVDTEERQGVRYMWLLLAMEVAQDENLFIEY